MLPQRAHGHVWTIGPRLGSALRGGHLFPCETVTTALEEDGRPLRLTGKWSPAPEARAALVILHGCGGTPDSDYCARMGRFFYTRGFSVLRLAWRGADLLGEDIYHAGQTRDLHAAIASSCLSSYETLWVVGFSLGGHAVLRFAAECNDARVRAIGAVCPVLDLPEVSRAIDAPERWFYRMYTLRGLVDTYAKVAARGRGPTPLVSVARARTFRAYDSLTVVPRYGFRDVDDYYESQNVRHVLGKIAHKTLVISSRHDPMLPAHIASDARKDFSHAITFRWAERGGHCFFPGDLDLGERGTLGLEAQLLTWLLRQG